MNTSNRFSLRRAVCGTAACVARGNTVQVRCLPRGLLILFK